MSLLLYTTIGLSVLVFVQSVVLAWCLWRSYKKEHQYDRYLVPIPAERERYELSEAGSESFLLSRPYLRNLGRLTRFVRRTEPEPRVEPFHIALMASDTWLSQRGLSSGKINTAVDIEGYEYLLYANCWVNIEDETGKLLPYTPESSTKLREDERETPVWAVAELLKKPIARIDGILVAEGAMEHDLLRMFEKLPIPVITSSSSLEPWVGVREEIQRKNGRGRRSE